MASKIITVDFYELSLPGDAASFETMLPNFVAAYGLEQRTKAISGQFIRVSEIHCSTNTIEGDFTKIRMDNLPDKGSLAKPDEPLGLLSDQGLSAGRAFFYFIPWKVFAVQRNKNGSSVAEMEGYFQQVFGLNGVVELKPILQKDAYMRLQKITEIKSFEVKFAGLQNATLLQGAGHHTEKLIDLIQYFQAPQASIKVSVGRQKRASLFAGLKDIASRIATVGIKLRKLS